MIPETLQQLLSHLPEIPDVPISEARLSALSRIYISIYKLIVVNDLDDELGSRIRYERMIDALFERGWACYSRLKHFEIRGRLLHTLFSLTFEPGAVADEHRAAACIRAADTLVREYLATLRTTRKGTDPEGQADVMRCAADLAFPGRNDRPAYRILYRERLTAWAAALRADGSWPGLSRSDALRRIGLMNRDSYMFPEGGYEPEARRAFAHYVRKSDFPDRPEPAGWPEICELGLLYEILVQGNLWRVDEELVGQVVAQLWNYVTRHRGSDDDAWVYSLSILVQHACEKYGETLQRGIV